MLYCIRNDFQPTLLITTTERHTATRLFVLLISEIAFSEDSRCFALKGQHNANPTQWSLTRKSSQSCNRPAESVRLLLDKSLNRADSSLVLFDCAIAGGKGTPRRKAVRKPKGPTGGIDGDKKLQNALKKLNVQPLTGIEEVNMFKDDGNVLHFQGAKGAFIL